MLKSRQIIVSILLVLLAGCIVQCIRLTQEMIVLVDVCKSNVAEISTQAKTSLNSWNTYATELNTQLNDPQVKKGVGLLLRSGDDLARTVKKVNVLLENLDNEIRVTSANLNQRAIPAFVLAVGDTARNINDGPVKEMAGTLQTATATLQVTKDSIQSTSSSLSETMGRINTSLEGIEARVNDPNIVQTIKNIESATNHANIALEHVEIKTKQLTKPGRWVWRGIKEFLVIIGRIFIP